MCCLLDLDFTKHDHLIVMKNFSDKGPLHCWRRWSKTSAAGRDEGKTLTSRSS